MSKSKTRKPPPVPDEVPVDVIHEAVVAAAEGTAKDTVEGLAPVEKDPPA